MFPQTAFVETGFAPAAKDVAGIASPRNFARSRARLSASAIAKQFVECIASASSRNGVKRGCSITASRVRFETEA